MKKLFLTLFPIVEVTLVYAQYPYVQQLAGLAQISFKSNPKNKNWPL